MSVSVLDTGEAARAHCKASGLVSLATGITMAYQLYELRRQTELQVGAGVAPGEGKESSCPDKVIMIMGFAACADAWLPTLKDFFARGDKVAGIEVVVYDNRGIGRSTAPAAKSAYTTDIMAADALALMDHLGWQRAHVVGHSMGGMIASRLAVLAPERVASLMLISVTGGGAEAIPTNAKAIWTALRGMVRSDTHARASIDLTFHFSPKLLKRQCPDTGRRVKAVLVEEYVAFNKENGLQTQHGQDGHTNAVMKHRISDKELRALAAGGFPIKVIHGSDDILANPRHAARLALHLGAPLVMLDGAHFITRDCAAQINDELLSSIEAVRRGASFADAVHPAADPLMYKRGFLCCA